MKPTVQLVLPERSRLLVVVTVVPSLVSWVPVLPAVGTSEIFNLGDYKCERSGVCTWENGRPRANAAIAFCRFTFTFPRFSCVKLEDTEDKACSLVDITLWRARLTVNASGSYRTCEKRLTQVIRRKKGIDGHDVKYHIVHL